MAAKQGFDKLHISWELQGAEELVLRDRSCSGAPLKEQTGFCVKKKLLCVVALKWGFQLYVWC